jgi:pyruvate/oxaloacetate carboxyltransferase
MTILKAIEAGADIVDTALSPLANGTSQPTTESMVATLAGTEYDTGLELDKLVQASEYFKTVADRLKTDKILDTKYEVTISDEVLLTEFYEKYEVISQNDKIFTVREKE